MNGRTRLHFHVGHVTLRTTRAIDPIVLDHAITGHLKSLGLESLGKGRKSPGVIGGEIARAIEGRRR